MLVNDRSIEVKLVEYLSFQADQNSNIFMMQVTFPDDDGIL